MHVQNKKYVNFVSVSSLTGECPYKYKYKFSWNETLYMTRTCIHSVTLFTHESCIPDSTNFISTVYIRHIQPIHIFIIYK